MARVFYLPPVLKLVGTLGGASYGASKYNYIIRSKPRYCYKNTPYQSRIRNHSFALTNAYRSLTPEQLVNWKTFSEIVLLPARRAPNNTLDGYGCFLKLNQRNLLASRPLFLDPPTVYDFVEVSNFLCFFEDNFIHVNYNLNLNPDNFFIVAFFSPVLPNSISNADKFLRYVEPDTFTETLALYCNNYKQRFSYDTWPSGYVSYKIYFLRLDNMLHSQFFKGKLYVEEST